MNQPDQASSEQAWQDALLALLALQLDPLRLGGIWLRAGHGPVRQRWLELLYAWPLKIVRLPGQIDDARLLGGMDLPATLQSGRLVHQTGLLAQADGGLIVLGMAERASPRLLAHINQAQDSGQVCATHAPISYPSRFGVIALDEAEADEAPLAPALAQRLGLWLDLRHVSLAHSQFELAALSAAEYQQASHLLAQMPTSAQHIEALCQTALALGVDDLRAPLLGLRLACVSAALNGRSAPDVDDLQLAVRLVLVPRATRWPAAPESEPEPPAESDQASPEPPEPPESKPSEPTPPDATPQPATPPEPEPALPDLLLAAAAASLPPHLLDQLLLQKNARQVARGAGQSGQRQTNRLRGRPLSPRPGQPHSGARLHLLATLMSAAPKQRLRKQTATTPRVQIRSEDFHIQRYARQTPSCLIFALDASGSAAQARLAEAKGAIELLLEQSYARRDSVCVIAFRLASAQLILPATRSLLRAKRALAGLPGGGGTPLASAIAAALNQAQSLQRFGSTPFLVLLSDGRANVSLAGIGGRAQARADAQALARQWQQSGYAALWIDSALQPEPQAQQLAALMGAHYFPMPQQQAQRLATVVQEVSAQLRQR